MKRGVKMMLGLIVAMTLFWSCSNNDSTTDTEPTFNHKVTVESEYESSNAVSEPEIKYEFYHTTLGYGGMEYNLPEPVSIFDDFVEDTWMKYWTLAWGYPYVINSYDRLYSLTEWKLNVDFEKYSLIAIGTSFYNSACSYKLDVVNDNNSYKVELSIYNPPIYLDDILSGVILLQVPKIPDNTLVNFKSTTYQIEE